MQLMNRTLRIALCGHAEEEGLKSTDKVDTGEGQTIEMSGPLAHVYTQALQVVYAKPDNLTGEINLESMANDALIAIGTARASINGGSPGRLIENSKLVQSTVVNKPTHHNLTHAFVISGNELTEKVIDVAASNLGLPSQSEVFMVIDLDGFPMDVVTDENGTATGLRVEKADISNTLPSLEAYASRLGFTVVRGIGEFIKTYKASK